MISHRVPFKRVTVAEHVRRDPSGPRCGVIVVVPGAVPEDVAVVTVIGAPSARYTQGGLVCERLLYADGFLIFFFLTAEKYKRNK